MKRTRAHGLTRLILCLALTSGATAQQKQPPQTPARPVDDEEVITLNTDLVQLRAVVTDRKGQPVDNLTKDDFEVFENGQPQAVSFFSVERVAGAAPAQPAGAAARANPARSIVLFVDTLHMSAASLARAKQSLRKFVNETMTDRDTVAVVATSGSLGILQQFTSDRRVLLRAIDKLGAFSKASTAFTASLAADVLNFGSRDAVNAALAVVKAEEGYESPYGPAGEGYVQARAHEILAVEDNLRRATLATLAGVSARLATMKGQRMIAFVSDGFTNYDVGGTQDDREFQKVVGRAARSGVLIYSMYAMGLVADPNRMTGTPDEAAKDTLYRMADATGGEAYVNVNDISLSMRKMVEGNSVYYVLAYYPPKGGDPKKTRKLSVRLKGHPEYHVRAQRGYVPEETRPAEVAAATPREKLFQQIIAPLPTTNVGVTSSSDFLESAGDDAQVTLQIHIDGDRLQYEKQGDTYQLRCEIVSVVFDQAGKIADHAAETINAALNATQLAEARRAGYRYSRRLKLKPGLYQVRVGVREVGSELTGTSISWVDVPDLQKGKLALSSLFIGRVAAAATTGAGAGGAKGERRAAPQVVVGDASFHKGDVAFYRFVVYNAAPVSQPGAGATLKVEVMQDEKPVYEGGWQPLAARAIRADAKGTEAGGEVRLALPPGAYTLRVTVKDGKSRKTEQSTDFVIES